MNLATNMRFKRFLAVFLAVGLVFAELPTNALAELAENVVEAEPAPATEEAQLSADGEETKADVEGLGVAVQPRSVTGVLGSKVELSTEGEGDNLSYEWRFSLDGSVVDTSYHLTGVRKPTISLNVSTEVAKRTYWCHITDSRGNSINTDPVTVSYETRSGCIAFGISGDDVEWVIDDNGLLSITGTGETGYPYWSDFISQVTGVRLSEGITAISPGAFAEARLTSLQLPSTLETIGEYSFKMARLPDVRLPETVKVIGEGAFYTAIFVDWVIVPSGLTELGYGAFERVGYGDIYAASQDIYDLLLETGEDGKLYTKFSSVKLYGDLNDGAWVEGIPDQPYTGEPVVADLHVMYLDEELVQGVDYDVSYADNTKVGTATVTITGKGSCFGTLRAHFDIVGNGGQPGGGGGETPDERLSIEGANVSVDATGLTYTGSKLCPAVSVTLDGRTLSKGSDYSVSYDNNVNAGTATVSITGMGNYYGSKTASFKISRAASTIKLAAQTKTYTGKVLAYSLKPTRTGSTGAVTYKYYSDANCTKAVAAANVKNAGTYYVKATVAADDNYKSATSAAVKFTVSKATSTIKLAAQSKTYTGKALAYSLKPTRTGSTGAVTYKYYSDANCTKAVSAANVKAARTYYVKCTVAADDNYKAATSAAAKFTITKTANPMRVSVATKTVAYSKVKAGAQAVAPITVTKAQGTKSFAVSKWTTAKAKSYFTVNKTTGKVTAKKGTPKGTYKFQVKVTAKGNSNYKSASKTVTVTVIVK